MPKGYYRTVAQLLSKAGWSYRGNAKGSHEKWQMAGASRTLIVPRNLYSRHTANAILRDAGVDKRL